MQMATNMMAASHQWANRPVDERYGSIAELLAAAKNKKDKSRTATDRWRNMRFAHDQSGEIQMIGSAGRPAMLTNHAFGQIATKVGFSASSLESLTDRPDLVVDILNHKRSKLVEPDEDGDINDEMQILLQNATEGLTIRSVNSERYSRVHDAEVIQGIIEPLAKAGFKVPPARPAFKNQPGTRKATKDDVLNCGDGGIQVKEGDLIAPAGLYMGDKDMFAIMVNKSQSDDDGGDRPIMRGIMVVNSEVGTKPFTTTEFLCDGVCGNHIIWGATDIVHTKYRHVGDGRTRIFEAMAKARDLIFNEGLRNLDREKQVFSWMRKNRIGSDKTTVVENIYSLRIPALTQTILRAAYDHAEVYRDQDGDPNTWFGMANALTRYSQTVPNADQRWAIDSGTGKVYEAASKEVFANA